MTILDDRPTYTPRLHRRHEIITIGGMDGVLQIAAILGDHPVREFAADVREGVMYSSVTCTVSLTDADCRDLRDRLQTLPDVVAVDPC